MRRCTISHRKRVGRIEAVTFRRRDAETPSPRRENKKRMLSFLLCADLCVSASKVFCYDDVLRLGIHTSTSGSLEGAALTAAELGANTFQIFSASPRMWRASVPDPEQTRLIRAARERFDLNPLVVHASYLINLASQDPLIRAKSIDGFRGEIERAAAIGAEYLVV